MVGARNAPKSVEANKFLCGVCIKSIKYNSIKCLFCGFWVHKHCSSIKGPLKPKPDFKCKKCRGEISNATIPASQPSTLLCQWWRNKKRQVFLLPQWLHWAMKKVSMPQLPEQDLYDRSLVSFCQFSLAVVFLWKHMVMSTMHVSTVSYCMLTGCNTGKCLPSQLQYDDDKMDLLHKAYRQDTIRWTKKSIGSV